MRSLLAFTFVVLSSFTHAEQYKRLGAWDVHYVLLPTTFLKPEIASSYGVRRAGDLALLNISVLSPDGGAPAPAAVEGSVTNLLGQRQRLSFREVREDAAIYYLATIRHTDREVLRFEVLITPPDEIQQTLRFQQQVYVEGR